MQLPLVFDLFLFVIMARLFFVALALTSLLAMSAYADYRVQLYPTAMCQNSDEISLHANVCNAFMVQVQDQIGASAMFMDNGIFIFPESNSCTGWSSGNSVNGTGCFNLTGRIPGLNFSFQSINIVKD